MDLTDTGGSDTSVLSEFKDIPGDNTRKRTQDIDNLMV